MFKADAVALYSEIFGLKVKGLLCGTFDELALFRTESSYFGVFTGRANHSSVVFVLLCSSRYFMASFWLVSLICGLNLSAYICCFMTASLRSFFDLISCCRRFTESVLNFLVIILISRTSIKKSPCELNFPTDPSVKAKS